MTAIRSVTIEFRKPSDTEDITVPYSVDISHMSMEEEVPVNMREHENSEQDHDQVFSSLLLIKLVI